MLKLLSKHMLFTSNVTNYTEKRNLSLILSECEGLLLLKQQSLFMKTNTFISEKVNTDHF